MLKLAPTIAWGLSLMLAFVFGCLSAPSARAQGSGIAGDPKRFRGSGSVALTADVASGDLHRFHVVSTAKFHQMSLELPDRKLAVVGLDGSMPFTEDIHVQKKEVTFAELRDANAYPTLRFSDQHPFLSNSGGLTAKSVTVGNLTLTHLAGNLRLQRNLFAIDQLEAETRGGHVTAQCLLALKGMHSTVQLHLRMTGIQNRRIKRPIGVPGPVRARSNSVRVLRSIVSMTSSEFRRAPSRLPRAAPARAPDRGRVRGGER